MFEPVIVAKAGVAIAAALLGYLLLASGRFERMSAGRFTCEATLLTAATRIALFIFVYVVLKQVPQSDICLYYDWAKPILDGKLPYRDTRSCYAPIFSYATALPLLIYDSPKSIIVLSILFEVVSVPVWLAVGRRTIGERLSRAATLLTIANAVAWFATGVSGVNQSWMTLLLGLSILLLIKSKPLASGLVFAVMLVAVKFICLLWMPAMFLSARRGRWLWAAGFLVLTALVYGAFAPFCDIFFPFRALSLEYSSTNVMFLLSLFGVPFDTDTTSLPARLESLAGLGVLGLVLLVSTFRRASRSAFDLMPWCVLLTLTLLIFSRKSHIWYLAMVTFPLCATLASTKGRYWAAGVLGLLGIIGLPEGSLYFRNMLAAHVDLRVIWSRGTSDPKFKIYVLLLLMNILQVSIYALLAWISWRALTEPRSRDAVGERRVLPDERDLRQV